MINFAQNIQLDGSLGPVSTVNRADMICKAMYGMLGVLNNFSGTLHDNFRYRYRSRKPPSVV
ncbi:MAG: hypothetical protein Q8M08_10135 [Bacteroidales bacterium]|nr:hypothetical protein [Bacteroidales bacterium]